MSATLINFAYLIASVLFILGLKGLTHPRTAVRGNLLGALGMLLAVVVTLLDQRILSGEYILLGAVVGALVGMILAVKIPLTSMPELVAVFNGLGGGASALVAGAALIEAQAPSHQFTAATAASGIIGAVTFWGSIVAFLKLMEVLKGLVRFPGQQLFNGVLVLGSVGLGAWLVLGEPDAFWAMVGVASLLGLLLVLPIGGADMPVVIALLNSCSGLAAAATGFVLDNNVLIIAGSLVGASGLILTQIMCRAMNRSLGNVFFGGVGAEVASGTSDDEVYAGKIKSTSAEEVALLFDTARRVVVVPRLWHGRGSSATRRAGFGQFARRARRRGRIRHPSGGRSDAGPHERAVGRGRSALRQVSGDGPDQPDLPADRCGADHWCQRCSQPPRPRRGFRADCRNADSRRGSCAYGGGD